MAGSTFDYLLLFVIGGLAGGWAIPAGITIGLDPIGVLLVSWLGTVAATSIWMALGGRGRDALVARLGPDAEERITGGRASQLLDRWGVVGLAAGGMVLLGPTITILAVLVLGVDRRRFLIWSSVTTILVFTGLTAFWSLVL